MKVGDWVKLRRLEDGPLMMIVIGPYPMSAQGFAVESVTVFWLTADDYAQVQELPLATLELADGEDDVAH
jgi:hypothetical protein